MATPWQKVYRKFGCSQAALAKAIGRNRSKISRALRDPDGLIGSQDLGLLTRAADERGVDLTLDDLRPDDA